MSVSSLGASAGSLSGVASYDSDQGNMVDNNGLVKLNVGGTWYTTTEATLKAHHESIFPKMLTSKNNKKKSSKESNGKGYYFVDRDGKLFRHVLNYMRTSDLSLPHGFQEYELLIQEAEFYGLRSMANLIRAKRIKSKGVKCTIIEVVETAHPEKIGVCSSRIVMTDDVRKWEPFCDAIDKQPDYYNETYRGQLGRFWIRTNITRLDWAEKLRAHGWEFLGVTSICRRLPDVTGQGTDLCHIVEKWKLDYEW